MIQRLLANNRNVIPAATLVASSVKPSPAVFPLTPTRSGRGRVQVTGEYTGHADTTFDIEIVAGSATRATEPVFSGQGSGRLSDSAATGLDAQAITIELKDLGIPSRSASLTAYGITITARTAGNLGNAVRISIDDSLLTTAPLSPERRTPALIQEGQQNLTGPEWDFDAPPLTADGRVPDSAPRLRFEGEPTIFRQYKVFENNDWQYRITPKPLRAIPAGRKVSAITGGRVVTVEDGISTDEEFGRVTYPCTLGTITRTGTGNGTLSSATVGTAAVAETITVTFSAATVFYVTGSVTGSIGSGGTTGTSFTSTKVNFTITAGATAFISGDTFTIPVVAPLADTGTIITLFDLLDALKGSLIVALTGAVINDTAPDGMGAIDCPIITTAHSRQWGANSQYFTGFTTLTVASTAPTETLILECISNNVLGSEVWSVTGTASGSLAQAVSGVDYIKSHYRLLIPQKFPAQSTSGALSGGIYLDKVQYVARSEVQIEPPICIKGGVLGRAAVAKSITLTWTKYRNVEGCACETTQVMGAVNRALLGVPDSTEGGMAMLDPLYAARLLDLYEWKNSYIQDNVRYTGGESWTVAGTITESTAGSTMPYSFIGLDHRPVGGGWNGAYTSYTAQDAAAALVVQEGYINDWGYDPTITVTPVDSTDPTIYVRVTHTGAPLANPDGSYFHGVFEGTISLKIPDGNGGFIYRVHPRTSPYLITRDPVNGVRWYSTGLSRIDHYFNSSDFTDVNLGMYGDTDFFPSSLMIEPSSLYWVIEPTDPDYTVIAANMAGAIAEQVIGGIAYDENFTAVDYAILQRTWFNVAGSMTRIIPKVTTYSTAFNTEIAAFNYSMFIRNANPGATIVMNTTHAVTNVGVDSPTQELSYINDVYNLILPILELCYSTPAALIVWDELKATIVADFANFVTSGEQWELYDSVILERYRAKINLIYLTLGLVPGKTDGSAGSAGGWSRKPLDYWNIDGYAPVYNNEVYHSTKFNADGDSYCTQEFALAVAVKCPQHLLYGDTITVNIDGGVSTARTYLQGDRITVPIVAATPLQLTGGVTGDDTLTWGVIGSVEGAFADYAVVDDTPSVYSDHGLEFKINTGGIPWAIGDAFTFGIEAGLFKWRQGSGTWSADLPLADTALFDGLGVTFRSGISPSFPAGDAYPFRAQQPAGPAGLTLPSVRSAWTWTGATATLTATFTAQTVSGLGIITTVPVGAVITAVLKRSGSTVATPTLTAATAGGLLTSIFTGVIADTLTLTISAANNGSIVWLWLGTPLSTVMVPEITLRKQYDLTHGPTRNASALYGGVGVAGAITWSQFLTQTELTAHLDLIDHVKENGDEPLIMVPHYLHPEEAAYVTLDTDAIDLIDEFSFHPDDTTDRALSLKLPFGPVYR